MKNFYVVMKGDLSRIYKFLTFKHFLMCVKLKENFNKHFGFEDIDLNNNNINNYKITFQ